MKEPSNDVINYFKLHAAVFLLKLEDSNSLGLFEAPEGGEGEGGQNLKSKTIVSVFYVPSAAGLMTLSPSLLVQQSQTVEMNPDGLLHENVFIL